MADTNEFFREVDEEYRRDRILQIWTRHGGIIVAALLVAIAGVGGWRYWSHVEHGRAEAAGVRYQDAVRLAQDGKPEDAEKALEHVARDAPDGYRLLARFRLAAELGKRGPEDGAKAYDALAADAAVNGLWQDLARLRAAMLRFDNAEASAIRPALERLAAPTGAWRHSARELLGLSGLKAGDYDFAGRWFDQIAADRDTPPGLRTRLEIYTALVAAGPVQTTQ